MNQNTPLNKQEYNNAYEILVEGEAATDISGKLAYCFYKEQKREFIKNYRQKHNNKNPTKNEINRWFETAFQSNLEAYKQKANTLLAEFFTNLVEDHSRDIELEILRNVRQKDNFWRGVGENLVGSLIWTILIAILLPIFLRIAEIDIIKVLKGESTVKKESSK
jgi:hypothetical protein